MTPVHLTPFSTSRRQNWKPTPPSSSFSSWRRENSRTTRSPATGLAVKSCRILGGCEVCTASRNRIATWVFVFRYRTCYIDSRYLTTPDTNLSNFAEYPVYPLQRRKRRPLDRLQLLLSGLKTVFFKKLSHKWLTMLIRFLKS